VNILPQRSFLWSFIPKYDEVALFAMSLTCSLLIISAVYSHSSAAITISSSDFDPRIIAAIFVYCSGLVLSMYHAFTDRPKTALEKSFMLFFAVLLNSFSGIMSGMYELSTASGWFIVFPMINIVSSVILFLMFRVGMLSEANISDEHASKAKFIVTASVVLALFFICHYQLSLMWMQTLSVCVAYSTNLSRVVPLLLVRA